MMQAHMPTTSAGNSSRMAWLRRVVLVVSSTTVVMAPSAVLSADAGLLQLPASFSGRLACADCRDPQMQLDLWPDGVFHLRRSSADNPGNGDDLGRWRREPGGTVLLLYGGREMPLRFQAIGLRTLRPLDLRGEPVGSGAHDLVSDGSLHPAELSLGLHGMLAFGADAPRFEECLTGRSYVVAIQGQFVDLQRAYLAAVAAPGTPLMASFDGDIALHPALEGSKTEPTVVVRRFIGVWPGQSCERAMSRASLVDQYWRLVSLRGQPVVPAEGQREPHLVLHGTDGRYSAAIACDRVEGSYRVEDDRISLDEAQAVDRRPCAPDCTPACSLTDVLRSARRWSIHAQVLEWYDERGDSIALFEAVYLQ
jgi:heat shock protein HslJ